WRVSFVRLCRADVPGEDRRRHGRARGAGRICLRGLEGGVWHGMIGAHLDRSRGAHAHDRGAGVEEYEVFDCAQCGKGAWDGYLPAGGAVYGAGYVWIAVTGCAAEHVRAAGGREA